MPVTLYIRPDLVKDKDEPVRPVSLFPKPDVQTVEVTGVAMKDNLVLVGYKDNTAIIYDLKGLVIRKYNFDAAVSTVKM